MKDKRWNSINSNIQVKLKNLDEIKEKLDFEKLLVEYKKIKKAIKQSKYKLETEKNNDKVHSLEKEIEKEELNLKSILDKFKEVEKKEKTLFSTKNTIDSQISYLDNLINKRLFSIKNNEMKIEELSKIMDEKYLKSLEDEIKYLNKEKENILLNLSNTTNTIEDREKIKFITKNISKLGAELKKVQSKDKNKANNEINKLNEKNIDLKNESDQLQNNLNKYLELVSNILNALSFIDDDEINGNTSFEVEHLDVWYGKKQALFNVNINFPKNQVISIIGPSGCGKSTFLRTLNRINDNVPSFKVKGKILLDGEYDIFKLTSIKNRYDKMELSTLRTKVGMIFQQPNPFPMSIAKNVQYGPRIKGIKNKGILNSLTENSLKEAGLWEEVKDNLKALGTSLSGGQQQRLCIARAIANEPEILLMDEPTSALDPIAAKKVEDLILKLKKHYTVIMVTHSMQQAQRISDKTAFFYQGKLIEYGTTKQIFEKPKEKETKDYVSGKFG